MSIEKSVLTLDEIEILIKDRYDVSNIQDIIHIDNSSANCYRIICKDTQYFFKEIQSKYSLEKVQNECKINDFLKERNIPTTKFYKTLNGEYVWKYKNHVFHLQPYIDGKTYKMNTAPEWLINNSATFLGRIQKALIDYPKLEDGFGEKFFSQWDVSNSIEFYKNIIDKSKYIQDKEIKSKIIKDLKFKLSILPKIAKFKFEYNKFTVSNSHGDYSISVDLRFLLSHYLQILLTSNIKNLQIKLSHVHNKLSNICTLF